MKARKLVKKFLKSDVFINPDLLEKFCHKDLKVEWHSSSGLQNFDLETYRAFLAQASTNYKEIRTELQGFVSQKDKAAAKFHLIVKTVENPSEDFVVGYFIGIFKISEKKIVEICQMSQKKQ